ncbi:MAG: hypothetical protein AAF968_08305, partial [Pseudomonadota bacterium]
MEFRLYALVFSLVLLMGCADLAAVNKWATTATDATRFNQVVATYTDTPKRLSRYAPDQSDEFEAQAAKRNKQAETIRETMRAVEAYMSALAMLSGDAPVDLSEDIGTITTNLGELGIANATTLNAVGEIVSLLGNEAINVWRAERIGDLVEQGNAPLQDILGADGQLYDIVSRSLANDLDNERLLLQIYFATLERDRRTSPGARAALIEWREQRTTENARRTAVVEAYKKILIDLAEGHQSLYDSRNDLD